MELNANFADVLITLNEYSRRDFFFVSILDDELFESVEDLNLELKFAPFATSLPPGVTLNPHIATVNILDNDGMSVHDLLCE